MFTTNDKMENPRPTALQYMKKLGKDVSQIESQKNKLPYHIQRRNLWIKEDKKGGMSLKKLSQKYGLKPEQINSILYKPHKSKMS